MPAPEPTAIERWFTTHLPPTPRTSAEALYALMPQQRGGQLPFVDVPYDPWREEHWAEAARIADYVAHLPAHARRVLDVGPGDGWPALPVAAACPTVQVVGIDPAPLRAHVCAENAARLGIGSARFLAGDAARLPFADSTFDLVTAASSLEEAAEPAAVFAELRRVLRPGGALRASYQDWALLPGDLETVLLWDGRMEAQPVRCFTYVRRVRVPAIERRYTVVLPADGPAVTQHEALLLAAAAAPRAYGESVCTPALGMAALERIAPFALGVTVVELQRWTTEWLVEALRAAGFGEVRASVHPGELGRRFARALLRDGQMERFAPLFAEATRALGTLAGSQPGRGVVAAVR